jgi:glycosyltransferase involved in cell wall biosynthesis
MNSDMKWYVSMIGSREHYAVPRALYRRGVLERFYTDLWIRHGRSVLLKGPGPVRRMAGRFHGELPSDRISSFNLNGVADLAAYEFFKHTSAERRRDFLIRQGQNFASRVAKHILGSQLEQPKGVFLGFKNGSLETFQALERSTSIIKVLDQFDAAGEHAAILASEHKKWPGWETPPSPICDALQYRWAEEWRLADVVFVNSEWTKRAIVKQGVPPEKIAVGALAYEPKRIGKPRQPCKQGRVLRVLWVGGVTLGKGIQYLIEAARSLDPERFHFTIVGAIGISQKGLDLAPKNMIFVGQLPRPEVEAYYEEADVYVLPTLSDNWPMTQLEAMAHGLPVIITTSAGTAVEDGRDGLIVPAGDSDALCQALIRLNCNRDELSAMSYAALVKSQDYSLSKYAERLVDGVAGVLAHNALSKIDKSN